ncbi:Glutathione peroxidase family protein [hydrothermal vent metagenome]|uniref:Glutathione peroxidase family protein n=1 Tax=hydrothermal vent metagenome TaxID=652676 RepID=A0A1W1CJQ0_9ZZZZ
MKKILLISLLIFGLSLTAKEQKMNIYDFTVQDIDGKEISMSKYKGKMLLIVNVASKCKFTSQYEGLEKLYQKYKNKGIMVLGFPSNQFSEQEPASNGKIKFFCTSTYDVHFDMFAKIDVNGKNTSPLYAFLKKEQTGFLGTESIKWNFTKFLIGQNGEVLKRYGSSTKPKEIEKDLEKLLLL